MSAITLFPDFVSPDIDIALSRFFCSTEDGGRRMEDGGSDVKVRWKMTLHRRAVTTGAICRLVLSHVMPRLALSHVEFHFALSRVLQSTCMQVSTV